jgi:YVTN family beta-propeller protein
MTMANKVAAVNEVTEALGGLAVADRPVRSQRAASLELSQTPTRSVRAYLQTLPDSAAKFPEAPLIETDTSPGFAAVRQSTVGRGPIAAISVDPRDGQVYVANAADDSISVLDPATGALIATVEDTAEPFALTVHGGRAFVSTVAGSHDAISVVDMRSATDPESGPIARVDHPVALAVRDLVVSADGRYVYAVRTGRSGADLAIVDTAAGRVSTVDLRTRDTASAEAVTLSPDGRSVYVVTADHLGGEFIAVDVAARRVRGGLAFPAPLRDVVAGPGASVFVAGSDPARNGLVDVIDTRSLRVVDSLDIGGPVSQIVVSASGTRLYAVSADQVVVLCLATGDVIDTITAVTDLSCIAESADGKRLFIADYHGQVTSLRIASSTESKTAVAGSDVIDVAMLELERRAV